MTDFHIYKYKRNPILMQLVSIILIKFELFGFPLTLCTWFERVCKYKFMDVSVCVYVIVFSEIQLPNAFY